jgi:hypothetical protein
MNLSHESDHPIVRRQRRYAVKRPAKSLSGATTSPMTWFHVNQGWDQLAIPLSRVVGKPQSPCTTGDLPPVCLETEATSAPRGWEITPVGQVAGDIHKLVHIPTAPGTTRGRNESRSAARCQRRLGSNSIRSVSESVHVAATSPAADGGRPLWRSVPPHSPSPE